MSSCLYRCYDEDGVLLYVGISLQPAQRMSNHRRSKDWWPEVSAIAMQHFSSKAAAREAEKHAIKAENPKHNILDAVPPDQLFTKSRYDQLLTVLDRAQAQREHEMQVSERWRRLIEGVTERIDQARRGPDETSIESWHYQAFAKVVSDLPITQTAARWQAIAEWTARRLQEGSSYYGLGRAEQDLDKMEQALSCAMKQGTSDTERRVE